MKTVCSRLGVLEPDHIAPHAPQIFLSNEISQQFLLEMNDIAFDIELYIDWRSMLIGFLVFAPLEHILPLRKNIGIFRRHRLTDFAHFFLSGFVIRLSLLLVMLAVVPLSSAVVPAGMQAWVHGLPLPLQVVLAALIADFGVYWGHRAMHKFPVLWHFHAVHHSSEEMDWLAAFRVHPIDQMILKGVSILPLFALGFSASAMLITTSVYVWQSLWVHSNVHSPIGFLNLAIAGPEFHHWHHANERQARDKNFSAQFPIWDIIFRTLYLPNRGPHRFGVDDPVPKKWAEQIVYPFHRRPLKTISSQADEA